MNSEGSQAPPETESGTKPTRTRRVFAVFDTAEGLFASTLLVSMVGLLTAELVLRGLGQVGIPAALPLVQHLTLWLAFTGAALAASEDRMLALATGQLLPVGRWRSGARIFSAAVAACVTALLAVAGWRFLRVEKEFGQEIALGIPTWAVLLVLPVSLGLIALRLVWRSGRWPARLTAALGLLAAAAVLAPDPEWWADKPAWPVLVVLAAAMICGAPIYSVLGGAAIFLFLIDWVPIEAVPVETYRLAVSPTLPAIPLFTLTGFLLAEGKSSDRLISVFRSIFGWIPGGTAVVAAVVCAFFTVFTGGSGVTILALGGLLFQALDSEGYRERFNLGLLTASGSLGLLLPPALPLILYGIVAEVPIRDLFLGGFLPGLLLVALIAAWGMCEGVVSHASITPFEARAAARALWLAKWELALPALLVGAILGGVATPVEASALSVVYALIVQCFVHRDLHVLRDLPGVFRRCVVLVGGVLIILCVAMGLTNYLVDAQIPMQLLDWVQSQVSSKLVFLLLLNVFLLAVGCLMDIFSATVVVVPLIVPLGLAYDIHPVHLGIIFIANLELGYLTPPVGLNLFLASYRFEKPLLTIYRSVVPMLVILALGVILITYFPWLTLVTLDWFSNR
ncbi:MAG: TRAP transporter large permease subunit [Thermoanaerobaculia bacterium]|nr:TRAP transporter large permease subunit [Thermoanaerobaculia bacterium]